MQITGKYNRSVILNTILFFSDEFKWLCKNEMHKVLAYLSRRLIVSL